MSSPLDPPVAAPAAPETPAAPAAPAPEAWHPAEVADFVQAKGWQSPADVIKSYQNLEGLQRTPVDRTVVLPETLDDPEALAPVFDRLGRPESPDGYEFEGYEPQEGVADLIGGDDGFRAVGHKLGLTKTQAGELYKWFTQKSDGAVEQTTQQLAERQTAEWESLKTEWGAGFDQKVTVAKQAVAALGIEQESLEAIERALGTGWLMKTFSRIGAQLGEHTPPGGDPVTDGAGGLTPAEAQAKLDELQRDDAFLKAYMEGNPEAQKRVADLTAAIAGTGLVRPDAVPLAR